ARPIHTAVRPRPRAAKNPGEDFFAGRRFEFLLPDPRVAAGRAGELDRDREGEDARVAMG
ncbi:MAG: hypothetical protein WAV45_12530, partial [Propionibacteriaceae bacterium]